MPYYHLERYITDEMLDSAAIEILSIIRGEMKWKFNKLAEDMQLPEGARPLWRLSWEYLDERGEECSE